MVAPSDIAPLVHAIALFCITIVAGSPRYAGSNAKYMLHLRHEPRTRSPANPGNNTIHWPQPAHELSPAAKDTIQSRFIEASCSADQKSKIRHAWSEAKLLAEAQTTKVRGYRYDIAHTQWLGRDWNSQRFGNKDYRTAISRNMARSLAEFNNNAAAAQQNHRYFHCHDHGHHCTEAGTQAYSWDSKSGQHTVFCAAFFASATLTEQMATHASNTPQQKIIENFHHNTATTMFRELWHHKTRKSGTFIHSAQETWEIARTKGTSWAYRDVDAYVLNAVAIYVQQCYRSGMAPVPRRELGKFDGKAAAAAAVVLPRSEGVVRSKRFRAMPPGWAGLVACGLGSYDAAMWEIF